MTLFELPSDLLINISTAWLSLPSIAKLDSALSNCAARMNYFDSITSQNCVFASGMHRKSKKFYEWIEKRRIHVNSITFDLKILSLQETVEFCRHQRRSLTELNQLECSENVDQALSILISSCLNIEKLESKWLTNQTFSWLNRFPCPQKLLKLNVLRVIMVSKLVQVAGICTNIQELCVNDIVADITIDEAMPRFRNLTTLRLIYVDLYGDDDTSLKDSVLKWLVQEAHSLTCLDVSNYTDVTVASYKCIVDTCSKLKSFSVHGRDANAALLAGAKLIVSKLKHLECIQMPEYGGSVDFLLSEMGGPLLERINFNRAKMTTNLLISCLTVSPNLKAMMVPSNYFTNDCVVAVMKHCGHLEYLKPSKLLHDNLFIDLMKKCLNLKQVEIQSCTQLTNRSLFSLAGLKHLEKLTLCGDTPGFKCGYACLAAGCAPLTKVSIEYLGGNERSMLSVAKVLRYCNIEVELICKN